MESRRQAPLETVRAKVLVTVKAYPQPSNTYDDLVCTAGVLEDGSWVRIYPVPFQSLLNQNIRKFEWIEIDLERNHKDFRPESYRPADISLSDVTKAGRIGTKGAGWKMRKEMCCRHTYRSLSRLTEDAYGDDKVSLATFKPTEIKGLIVSPDEDDWKKEWQIRRQVPQLFDGIDNRPTASQVNKIPYSFRYRLIDSEGRESRMKIIDWEIGALYRNCLAQAEGDEEVAIEKVREKYARELVKRDLHLFLGTTKQFHARKAPNPFIIIGVFYPPKDPQSDLFLT
jgi:hypothetical protein